MTRRGRLTVTVDPALIQAGEDRVAAGRVAKERPVAAMADAVAADEGDFGAISAEEAYAQARADREAAIVVGREAAGVRPCRSSQPDGRMLQCSRDIVSSSRTISRMLTIERPDP